ncbi:hypothetical protein SO802_009353 [Lithocarpus litseifolius]|uniref:Pectinesterase catalytic domain-containing protein n=1 Tax=Lithocarpus litseifolius TaxID=425828 RepID=A0AAW2DGR7_9ROSI
MLSNDEHGDPNQVQPNHAQQSEDEGETARLFSNRREDRLVPCLQHGGNVNEELAVTSKSRTYLGRPWTRYSRTVYMKTDLDGLIDPKGWIEWLGDYALSTLFYGEYMNIGVGASTNGRVQWLGFHVLTNPQEASPFTMSNFIQGESWIPTTGVPMGPGI